MNSRCRTLLTVSIISATFILFIQYTKKTYTKYEQNSEELQESNDNPTSQKLERVNTNTNYSDKEWNEFQNIISSDITRCHEILPDFNFPKDFVHNWKTFLNKVDEQKGANKDYEGNIEKYRGQQKLYYYLSNRTFVKTVCEIGFNFGHSAFFWLAASQSTMLYTFDIGNHGYTKNMADYFKHTFQDRFHILYGDSSVTVPALLDQNPWITCDVLVIDGGHTYEIAKNDLSNMQLLARKHHNVVIFDDYPRKESTFSRDLAKAWKEVQIDGKLKSIFSCLSKDGGHGFSVGQYVI